MPSEKQKIRFHELERLALAAGLRPYDVHFFEVPASIIWQTAAYGLPTRYSHWSFGSAFAHQQAQAEMGFSKIYELIISADPCIAYLDNTNTETVNLLIAAHCYAHSHFFRNNVMFKKTNERDMVNAAATHAAIIDQFRTDYGDDEVDSWLDVALALERHIDVHKGRRRSRYPQRQVAFKERKIDPNEDWIENKDPIVKKVIKGLYLPPIPEKDILWFLTEYANLEPWQKKIFEIVRRESYYFFPQYKTKILNEGWACVSGDCRVLTDKGLIKASDYVKPKHDNTLVFNGQKFTKRTSVHITRKKAGFKIVTNRGLSFVAAENHKVKHYTHGYIPCKDLKKGDKICLSPSSHIWPTDVQLISSNYIPLKHANKNTKQIDDFYMNADFARFLAFWIGEGSQGSGRNISIRNSDFEVLNYYGNYIKREFGLNFAVGKVMDDGNDRWDLRIHSKAFHTLLDEITGCVTCTAHYKDIPDIIFRSPQDVVKSFIQGLCDAEGCAYIGKNNKSGQTRRIVFASSSFNLITNLASLLHNFGIFGSLGRSKKAGYEDGFQLIICSKQNIVRFIELIGCNDVSKKANFKRMLDTIDMKKFVHKERDYAIVKTIEPVKAVFYDFTVPEGSEYSANGLMHHNSYCHALLMEQYALGNDNNLGVKDLQHPLTDEEHLDFVSYHEKVVQPGVKAKLKEDVILPNGQKAKMWRPGVERIFSRATKLNPYYVGYRILKDIKKRWDEYYEQGFMKNQWDEEVPVTINGDTKVLQVIDEEDDLSFLRNYLTEELASELHIFAYGSTAGYKDSYSMQEEAKRRKNKEFNPKSPVDTQLIENKTIQIRTKELKDIIHTFAKSESNYGVPLIVVRRIDNSGMLRLEHLAEDDVNVDVGYAEHVLKYIYSVWRRPIEMVRKSKAENKTWLLTYDGMSFDMNYETLDYPESVEKADSASSW